MAAIDRILERSAKRVQPLAGRGSPKLCLVTCDDSALSGGLEGLLGLSRGEVSQVRLPAGSGALSEEWLQRAVAKAVYVEGCEEVLLLTHSSCTLYGLRTEQLLEAIGRAGVPRSAIPFDLREWVGAGRDPRQAVMDSAQALRRCGYLPATLQVHVAHLDEQSGHIQMVEHGESAVVSRPPSGAEGLSGYQPGPATPVEATLPLTVVPQVAELEPVQPPTPPPLRRSVDVSHFAKASAELSLAMETVRAFARRELPKKDRQWLVAALKHAAEQGGSSDELVKIALQPMLKTGQKRYQVIDQLIVVKEEVPKLPPAQALTLLSGLVE